MKLSVAWDILLWPFPMLPVKGSAFWEYFNRREPSPGNSRKANVFKLMIHIIFMIFAVIIKVSYAISRAFISFLNIINS